MRVHADSQRSQECLAQSAAGDAGRRLASRGPLEDVAHVGLLVLLRAHEIGVAGTGQVHLVDVLLHRPGTHALAPVGEVAVGDLQCDGTAERAPVANSAGDLRCVALDLHAAAATVAELAPSHVRIEVLRCDLKASRQALDDASQARAMRLAGGCQSKAHERSLFAGPRATGRRLPATHPDADTCIGKS